jgi:adenylate kinase family enzyme
MCRVKFPQKIFQKLYNKVKFLRRDTVWSDFVDSSLPIFWIIGPAQSGKTTLAHFLSECSNYRLIHMKHLAPQGTKSTSTLDLRDYVTLLKMEIKNTFKYCHGYIIDDFPTNMSECKRFERKLRKPTIIIYISISLDATLGRALAQHPTADLNAVRIDYVKQVKFSEKIYHRYLKRHNVMKIFSQYPIQDTHAKALEHLETEFGYKFRQIIKTT